ncbi:hypothetical protein Tco_0907451 [Tanacetum coccineum]|uniref:Uncharacterized protein n=1 Tax=Tanacetum coccineum TaxID=301880 RepID=A0ABQ5CJA0_9ASTR
MLTEKRIPLSQVDDFKMLKKNWRIDCHDDGSQGLTILGLRRRIPSSAECKESLKESSSKADLEISMHGELLWDARSIGSPIPSSPSSLVGSSSPVRSTTPPPDYPFDESIFAELDNSLWIIPRPIKSKPIPEEPNESDAC